MTIRYFGPNSTLFRGPKAKGLRNRAKVLLGEQRDKIKEQGVGFRKIQQADGSLVKVILHKHPGGVIAKTQILAPGVVPKVVRKIVAKQIKIFRGLLVYSGTGYTLTDLSPYLLYPKGIGWEQPPRGWTPPNLPRGLTFAISSGEGLDLWHGGGVVEHNYEDDYSYINDVETFISKKKQFYNSATGRTETGWPWINEVGELRFIEIEAVFETDWSDGFKTSKAATLTITYRNSFESMVDIDPWEIVVSSRALYRDDVAFNIVAMYSWVDWRLISITRLGNKAIVSFTDYDRATSENQTFDLDFIVIDVANKTFETKFVVDNFELTKNANSVGDVRGIGAEVELKLFDDLVYGDLQVRCGGGLSKTLNGCKVGENKNIETTYSVPVSYSFKDNGEIKTIRLVSEYIANNYALWVNVQLGRLMSNSDWESFKNKKTLVRAQQTIALKTSFVSENVNIYSNTINVNTVKDAVLWISEAEQSFARRWVFFCFSNSYITSKLAFSDSRGNSFSDSDYYEYEAWPADEDRPIRRNESVPESFFDYYLDIIILQSIPDSAVTYECKKFQLNNYLAYVTEPFNIQQNLSYKHDDTGIKMALFNLGNIAWQAGEYIDHPSKVLSLDYQDNPLIIADPGPLACLKPAAIAATGDNDFLYPPAFVGRILNQETTPST